MASCGTLHAARLTPPSSSAVRRCLRATWQPPRARNRLLFESHEVGQGGRITLPGSDSRAQHIAAVLRSQVGDHVRVGVVDGRPGVARIVEIGDAEEESNVELHCEDWGPLPRPSKLSLLLAMPRPRAMRRLWSVLGQMGLRHIYVGSAERVERYYFECQALQAATIRKELLVGLEQVMETQMPQVSVHKHSLKRLLALLGLGGLEYRPSTTQEAPAKLEPGTLLLVAHPDSPHNLASAICCALDSASSEESSNMPRAEGRDEREHCTAVPKDSVGSPNGKAESSQRYQEEKAALQNGMPNDGISFKESICKSRHRWRGFSPPVLLAIGPEGGWLDSELELMQEVGFHQFALGTRPLRTDVAIIAIISSLWSILGEW